MRNAKSRRGNQVLAAAVGAAGVMGLAAGAQAATYTIGTEGTNNFSWTAPKPGAPTSVDLSDGDYFYPARNAYPIVNLPVNIAGNVYLAIDNNGVTTMELTNTVNLGGGTRTLDVWIGPASGRYTKISGKLTNGGIKVTAGGNRDPHDFSQPHFILSGANNDYSLGTEISDRAVVEVYAGSSLGTGNVSITGTDSTPSRASKLKLDGNTTIADTKTLTIPSSGNRVYLNFTGNEVVGKLVVGTTEFTSGTYNKNSGTINGINFANVFDANSTGSIAIPEPSSAIGLLASGALMAIRRRRRN